MIAGIQMHLSLTSHRWSLELIRMLVHFRSNSHRTWFIHSFIRKGNFWSKPCSASSLTSVWECTRCNIRRMASSFSSRQLCPCQLRSWNRIRGGCHSFRLSSDKTRMETIWEWLRRGGCRRRTLIHTSQHETCWSTSQYAAPINLIWLQGASRVISHLLEQRHNHRYDVRCLQRSKDDEECPLALAQQEEYHLFLSLSLSNYLIEECCWAKLLEYVVAIIRMHPSRNGFSLASARSNVYLCAYELFLLSRWKWVSRDCWSKLLNLSRYELSCQADARCVTLNNKTFSQQSFVRDCYHSLFMITFHTRRSTRNDSSVRQKMWR